MGAGFLCHIPGAYAEPSGVERGLTQETRAHTLTGV